MLHPLLAAALAALAPLTFVPSADAGLLAPCEAYAERPVAESAYGTWARGGFACDDGPRRWLSVEVCLEVLSENLWERVACESATATDAADVSAEVWSCRYGPQLVRSVATGSASTGETDRAESVPVPFLCIPIA